jgi:hypothetical protein
MLMTLLVSAVGACTDGPTGPSARPNAADPSLMVTGPGDGGTCDPWMDLNWCKGTEGPGEPCEHSDPGSGEVVGVESCLPFFGSPPPANQPPADTCFTGDPIIENSTIKEGFTQLWMESNPGAAMEDRRERGAWIVSDGVGGYWLAPFTVQSSNACEMIIDITNQPSNAVAFVHTHPYESGVAMRVCEGEMIFGQMVYETYTNQPSDYDGLASSVLKIPGYILDYDKITKFQGNSDSSWAYDVVSQQQRCGY